MPKVGDIQYKSPSNVSVYGEDGNYHRAQLVAAAPGDIKYSDPDVSPNIQVMGEDGNYHRAQLVAMAGMGGSSLENRIIIKSDTIPTANADSYSKFYCFSGTTDSTYTHGYIYECTADVSTSYTIDLYKDDAYDLNKLAFNYEYHSPIELFERIASLSTPTFDPTAVKTGSFVLDKVNEIWYASGYDAEGNALFEDFTISGTGDQYSLDAFGFVYIDHFPDNFEDGYTENFELFTEKSYSNYRWVRLNVQPITGDMLGTGFDETKTQVLKNVNGTLTWVDE